MNDFLSRITKNIRDPQIEEGIKSGDPYTICDLLEQTKGGMYLNDLENAIIATDDIVQIYEFLFLAVDMKIPGFNQQRFEKLVYESRNPKLMCYCMGFVPGTNIELMLKGLEETQNEKYMKMIMQDEEYDEIFEQVKEIDLEYEEKVEEAKEIDWYPTSLEEFRDLKDNVSQLKEQVKATKNAHFVTELANYLEYLNECKGQSYDISDLTAIQEELQDPMQVYEYLSSVNVENKTGLLQTIVGSGKAKFMYYVYEYVPGLTEEEKAYLQESIIEKTSDKKYQALVKEEEVLEGNGCEKGRGE